MKSKDINHCYPPCTVFKSKPSIYGAFRVHHSGYAPIMLPAGKIDSPVFLNHSEGTWCKPGMLPHAISPVNFLKPCLHDFAVIFPCRGTNRGNNRYWAF